MSSQASRYRTSFEIGQAYSRQKDIHQVFDGQQQGGISTPAKHPYIFIFTGNSGKNYGYEDGWQDDDIFLYTGEGQIGDMHFTKGNLAIANHVKHGKEILLFENTGKGKPCIFKGRFSCQSFDQQEGVDRDGNTRKTIRFHLVKENQYADNASIQTNTQINTPHKETPLKELRQRALQATETQKNNSWRNARSEYYKRSKAVKEYVLARANGMCELTQKPAPFNRKDGSPYLEVHHIRRLSDDGPDHPRWVGAICPSIHREIHFGENGEKLNQQLEAILGEIEISNDIK